MFAFCGSAEEEVEDWDEATRRATLCESPSKAKNLCPECSMPLRRVSQTTCLAGWLRRQSQCEMTDCERQIEDGELHFACAECRLDICKSCGPGCYISRRYDYVDIGSGDERRNELRPRLRRPRAAVDPALARAQQVIERSIEIMKCIARDPTDIHDSEWELDGKLSARLFAGEGHDKADTLLLLADAACSVLQHDATLAEVSAPCKVFGDLHGHLRDLLLLFHLFGMPGPGTSVSESSPNFVFNGDFVDRGAHQVEVLGLLLALKVAYPSRVFLNRGNHEDVTMNNKYGFHSECVAKLGAAAETVYAAFQTVFEWLPMGCRIGKRILAVHAGIGYGDWVLDDLRQVPRPIDHNACASRDMLWNILWSDPLEQEPQGGLFRKTFGIHQSPRGKKSVCFGWNITEAFCAKNDLDLVVRSHQAKKFGLGFDVMHDDSLIRVFSARDYENQGNDAAILSVTFADSSDGQQLAVRPQVLRSITKPQDRRPQLSGVFPFVMSKPEYS